MTKKLDRSKDPDFIGSFAALRRALQIGLETGAPVYFMKKGRITDLTKEKRRKTKAR